MPELAHIPDPVATSPPPAPAPIRRRLIAAALSALIPGLGQRFLNERRSAPALFSALVVMALAFWPLRLPRIYEGLMTLVFTGAVLFNVAVFGALFSRDKITGTRLSLGWIPLGLLIAYVGFNITFTSLLFLASGLRTLRATISSMEPFLQKGDRLVYDRRYYRSHAKLRGDVVVMRRKDYLTIRRIIALPGDAIEGKEGVVYLNGQAQQEDYIQKRSPGEGPATDSFGPVTLPAGKYFVMGDNRAISLDSREPTFGLVSDDAILGKTLYFYKVGFGPGPITRRLD